jgi:hypothetical protein
MTLVRDVIVLSCSDGRREVHGWRVGKTFAVHRGSVGWTLTHAASGCAAGWFKTRKEAVALALDLIDKTPPEFWRVRTAAGLDRKARAMPEALAAVHRLRRKYGQRPLVRVEPPGIEYGRPA